MTPRDRAEKSAAAMWSDDRVSKWLGMKFVSVNEGTAVLSMVVEQHHCNGHGMCHGGITFSLADSAFAIACNSRNQATVAQNNMITYTAPARVGDTLTATAIEISLAGRSGIYDVRVSNQDDETIAEMRGLSRSIKGQLFTE